MSDNGESANNIEEVRPEKNEAIDNEAKTERVPSSNDIVVNKKYVRKEKAASPSEKEDNSNLLLFAGLAGIAAWFYMKK